MRAAVTLCKASGLAGIRVLVVDDNEDAAHTLATLLRMAGHQVQKATSGVDALRIAEDFRPRVIVLDLVMPEMSGYAVAERLGAAAWGKEVMLIAVTGYGDTQQVARARQPGFDHYLVKPIDVQQLLTVFPKSE